MSVADPARSDVVESFEAERRRMLGRHRLQTIVGLVLFSAVLALSLQQSGFIDANIGGDPLARIGVFLGRMSPKLRVDTLLSDRATAGSLASWFYDLPLWLKSAWLTFEMAAVATVIGAAGAVGASFLCARNLMPWSPVRFVVRRSLEAIEASGATRLRQIRYGVLPQVLPAYASYALIRLEGNLAAAAALGIVGAGGIGLELQRAITYTEFDTYLAILLLMVSMIFAIDVVSEQIRHRLIGLGSAR